MEATLHRFVRLLRLAGVRVSIPEALDAMRCAGQPGVLSSRAVLRTALRVALVKDERDAPVFDEIFDAFFSLVRVGGAEDGHGHSHAHDDLVDTGELESFTLSEEPSDTPEQGHEHGKPSSIRDYFKQEDLAQRYNLHQEANKIDLAALTDEIAFSKDSRSGADDAVRIQLSTDRLSGATSAGDLATSAGTAVDAELTIAEQDALLGWLDSEMDCAGDESDAAALRKRLAGVLENLPAALKRHLEALLALETAIVETRERREARVDRIAETERADLEDSLRRLARTLHGALTHRRRVAAAGRVDSGQTMRRNMRFDGVPFMPVTVRRAEDRPRLVVLADVSLSVRATSRFTLHLVHGLQDLFTQVRSFVFVADVAETTEMFRDHPSERALGLIFGGDVIDISANSDYGSVFGEFLAEHSSAITRRTTVLVLGDGRTNARDPNLAAFEEITRRARETVWLTPEPRYSWGLGSCDLPAYAEYCDRVRVVADLSGLETAAHEFAADAVGR
ncbi:VWA domain-containing protein [Mycolicibacterium rufum]|uniref:VWA domain-containing protein n=1 Tax=Mycolicibacterium rufum TaxID=318424 RepID=A0A9X2Y9S6_9MYCO|nr:VWA domain-containing protein [Mycolicibacterium rufum]KGI70137.1 von Willebrand factor A [Mycolicibacterium rufum]MCV7069425.1 VWA domain-containing protein [Mycolicibacterium rufum]ULP36414.1 VWA domain-containing protein [Mycolicibacterium rufum]